MNASGRFDATPIRFRHQAALERWFVPALLALALAIMLCGCHCPPEAVDLVRDGIAYNEGTAADPHGENPPEAERVAEVNRDLLMRVLHILDGTPLPERLRGGGE